MAKQHLVKCLYCGVTFDCAKEPFEKPRGNRYAHKHCYDRHMNSMSQEERDYEELVEYIRQNMPSNYNEYERLAFIEKEVAKQISFDEKYLWGDIGTKQKIYTGMSLGL